MILKTAASVAASMLLYQGAIAENLSAVTHEAESPTGFRTVAPQAFAAGDVSAYAGLYDSAAGAELAFADPASVPADSLALTQEEMDAYEAGETSVGTIVVAGLILVLLWGIAQDASAS